MTDATELVGVWRLRSWRTESADGTVVHPFGEHATGLLIYERSGVMSGLMTAADRPVFARPRTTAVDFAAGTTAELAAAFDTVLAYAGRWRLDDDGRVHHDVELATIPGWAGTTQLRHITLAGDRLTLRTPQRTVDEVAQHGLLEWDRDR